MQTKSLIAAPFVCVIAIASTGTLADDITVDRTGFTSAMSRDAVRAELKRPWTGGDPWAIEYMVPAPDGDVQRADVTRAFLADREQVRLAGGEDSGAHTFKVPPGALGTRVMGAPAR